MTDIKASIEAILTERKKTHGDFSDHARVTQRLKAVFMGEATLCNAELSDVQREAVSMILHKIGRIVAGNPNVKDHWDDIAGYAKLVADRVS